MVGRGNTGQPVTMIHPHISKSTRLMQQPSLSIMAERRSPEFADGTESCNLPQPKWPALDTDHISVNGQTIT